MTKTKPDNRAVRYFFFISLAVHTVFLLYLGRSILKQRYERRIEVDLKSLASAKPIRSIPLPYLRPKAAPETKQVKSPIRSLASKPVLTRAPARQQNPDRTFSAEAIEKIRVPLPDAIASDNAGVVNQITGAPGQGVEIPQVPSKIKIAYDTFDQTLAYQGIIRRRLELHKRFPPLAVKRGLEGRVGIRFLLHRDGQVEQVEVIKSSRISLFDKAALSAVRDGAPFPPFPESIPEEYMVIEVTLNFELRGAYGRGGIY